jgi:hypothetical protein
MHDTHGRASRHLQARRIGRGGMLCAGFRRALSLVFLVVAAVAVARSDIAAADNATNEGARPRGSRPRGNVPTGGAHQKVLSSPMPTVGE